MAQMSEVLRNTTGSKAGMTAMNMDGSATDVSVGFGPVAKVTVTTTIPPTRKYHSWGTGANPKAITQMAETVATSAARSVVGLNCELKMWCNGSPILL